MFANCFKSQVNAGTGGIDFLLMGDQNPSWDGGMLNNIEGMILPGPS